MAADMSINEVYKSFQDVFGDVGIKAKSDDGKEFKRGHVTDTSKMKEWPMCWDLWEEIANERKRALSQADNSGGTVGRPSKRIQRFRG